MKKIILFAAAIFATTFCLSAQDTDVKKEKNKEAKVKYKEKDYDNGSWSNWSGGERVRGEGPSVSETRDIKNFNGFKSSISADITLKQSSGGYKVTLDGQKNILALLKTEVVDGNLKISFEKGYSMNYREPLKITLEAPSFAFMGMSGSGNVRTNGDLTGEKMTISISGSGNFYLNDLRYNDLSVGVSGSGDVNLSGNVESVDLSISGSGDLKAEQFESAKSALPRQWFG